MLPRHHQGWRLDREILLVDLKMPAANDDSRNRAPGGGNDVDGFEAGHGGEERNIGRPESIDVKRPIGETTR
jgi:hypothetical protein